MRNWSFAAALAVTALIQLVLADNPLTIIGDDLDGPNVCKRIDNYNVSVVVTETVPYKESKMVWCAQIPPRCRKEEIRMKSVNRTTILEKSRAIRECCDGYVENNARNRCVPHCPKPCINGHCASPGQCKCQSGFGGPSCDIECPPNYYGHKCRKKCDCSNGAECDPYDGKCHCKKGYRGDKCEATCTPDRYGEGCSEICRCENGGKCNSISGECYCAKGFTGPLCQEKCGNNGEGCKTLCKCQNGGICDEDTQQCKCPPGWVGDVCANRCQPGRYGQNCDKACECFNGANCDHVNGDCVCVAGFTGKTCLDQCPFDKYGINCTETCSCQNGATCDKANGKCHCSPGWSGTDCSERQCPENNYGANCTETCECETENTELCHPHDGKCDCKPGWSSSTCNRPCPFLKYGKSCAFVCDCKNNAQCSPFDGTCFCPPGFTGEKCESHCPAGTHGQDCSQRCECKNGAECNHETGQCFCKPGWTGFKCERPCEMNKYGEGCTKTCNCSNNGGCNPISGECYCAPGWTGEACEKKCENWFFGQNCSFECNCERSRTLRCDPTNGQCICRIDYNGSQTIKYAGVRCESSCPLGFYGPECHHQCNCQNNSSCDPQSGECFCERGWEGRTCDRKCPSGYYGQNCKEKCSENMPQKTTCDHVTGEFKCRPGYIGITCDHPCKEGTFGEDCQNKCNCENGGECSHIDGICHCLPGWIGDNCEVPCSNGTWGNNCQHKCKCVNDGRCRKSDGFCDCRPGFMGAKCDEVCPEGFFGSSCIETCTCNRKPNFVCHPAAGCVCKSGFKGENCDVTLFGELTGEDEFDISPIATTENTFDPDVDDPNLLTDNPFTTTLAPRFTPLTQSVTEEIFTFHPIVAITVHSTTSKSILMTTSTSPITEQNVPIKSTAVSIESSTPLAAPKPSGADEVFTFMPLETTTQKAIVTEATITGVNSTTQASGNDLIGSSTTTSINNTSSDHDKNGSSTSAESDSITTHSHDKSNHSTKDPDETLSGADSDATSGNDMNGNETDSSRSASGESSDPISMTTPMPVTNPSQITLPMMTTQTKDSELETTTANEDKKLSTTNLPITDYSENPNHVLITPTEKVLSTSGLPIPFDEIDKSEIDLPKSSNEEVDEDLNVSGNGRNSTKPMSTNPSGDSEQSMDKNENDLVTEQPENKTVLDSIDRDLSSTASVFISILITSTHSSSIFEYGENVTMSSNVDPVLVANQTTISDSILVTNQSTSADPISLTNQTTTSNDLDDSKSEEASNTEVPQHSAFDFDLLNERNDTNVSTSTRKPRLRNFFYYYFISAMRANESRAREQNKTLESVKPQEYFMGLPVGRAGPIWGIFLSLLFIGIICTVLFYYRRRVKNLKAEINHVVKYMSEDRSNFDNPVYSYQHQGSISPDASTLLHGRNGMNNLRQTKPSNLSRLNNFDQDSNSSGRGAAYSLQYDSQLMNQKNHEADLTNPNVYNMYDDHLYDEIKNKPGDQDVEYDHLDYSRPIQPPIPHYHRTTSSAMSTISHKDRESNQSNSKFSSFSDSTYDAPIPHPKQLNINVPPLPMKNPNLTPSPSSSTASTITQDENIDAIISIDKPMNKNFLQEEDEEAALKVLNEKSRDESTD